MVSRLTIGLAALLSLALGTGQAGAASASWLDSPPQGWNTPGMAAPSAAPAMQNIDPRCQTEQAGATSPEQQVVAGAGWKLERYWPPIQQGALTLITALADYDGMCRPLAFNIFVFSGGKYAGTLSPVPMNSRSDGVLATPPTGPALSETAGGAITAQFTRYAPTDPLCCPSRGRTRVDYQLRQVDAAPVVVPVQIEVIPAAGQHGTAQPTPAPAPAQVPAQMPATGGGGAARASAPWAALVATLAFGGLALGPRSVLRLARKRIRR